MEWNGFSSFGIGSPKEHFCEIILKSVHWPRRRFLFLSLVANLFSGAEPFLAILVEGHPRNTPVKLFLKPGIDLGGDVV